ncbi:MAG: peptidoglycan DD-metalloendopeptidase family protein [Candidatus Obscuribacterales bacterium]|nr:peptidoglycan DD-metalloendopeptidase family protein [Candidatus Obscuribacterales bacterium]
MNRLTTTNKDRVGRLALPTGFAIALLLNSFSGLAGIAAGTTFEAYQEPRSTRSRLNEIEERKREIHEKYKQAKRKEDAAMKALHKIQQTYNDTKANLHQNEKELEKTQSNIKATERKIDITQSTEQQLSQQAAQRLREVYEGHRLSLLEMFFQVTSLQSLLDLFYYQERIAEADKKLLEELKQKAQALAAKKDFLGEHSNKLGEIITDIAKKASEIAKKKTAQEQIAERLKTQRAFYEQAETQLAIESQQLERQIVDLESSRRGSGDMAVGSGSMSMPIRAPISSPFGYRGHPIFGGRRFHSGVDLAGANHTPIKASDSGCVLKTGWYGGYGKVVIVSHGHGKSTLYAHMAQTAVSPGQNVRKGEVLGYEGSTGFSTGPHVHFEVRIDGKPRNPLNYVR